MHIAFERVRRKTAPTNLLVCKSYLIYHPETNHRRVHSATRHEQGVQRFQ